MLYHGMKELMFDVAAFHEATDCPVKEFPQIPPEDRQNLRHALVYEEYKEFTEAWVNDDLVGMADAIGDLIYVLVGTALEYGIPLDLVWQAIQRSNMQKIDPKTGVVMRREDGKILKPDEWEPPDIAGIIARRKTNIINRD